MDKEAVESGLKSKGFEEDKSGHHRYYIYVKTPVKTRTSHGSGKYKKLGNELVSQMARQCRLTKQEFTDLIHCPLDQNTYETKLSEQDVI